METPVRYVVDKPAPPPGVVLMQCPLAGFQFHAAEKCWRQLSAQDPLALVREPGNRHDPRAVRIEWQGLVLGYVPREANYTISQMLDRGYQIAGRIAALHESPDPWKRVMVEVEWLGDRIRPAKPTAVQHPAGDPLRDIALVDLGSFVTGAPPSKIDFARAVETLGEDARRAAALTLARCSAEIIGRLAMAVTGVVMPASRSVQLWGLLEITITNDGRTLSARSLDAARHPRSVSANLVAPISNAAWIGPFEAIVDRAAPDIDMGIVLANLPEHWLDRTLRRTFTGFIDFSAMRRAILGFLAPDGLTRSLANRIFENATAEQFNWCGQHRDALCLAAIEHPTLLPFLRWVEIDGKYRDKEPMAALTALLAIEGMDSSAAKRLEGWGYEPFSYLAQEIPGKESLGMLVAFANLLARLGLTDPPPAFFSYCAGAAAGWFYRGGVIFGTRLPDWFMRAMLREIERFDYEEDEITFGEQVKAAMPWIESEPPEPDSNQCKAGWPWIMERVRQFEIRQAKGEWPAALEERVIGGYRVVPIHTVAQLKSEAHEMKNCLENYAGQCKAGVMALFSIRTKGFPGGKRVAHVAAVRASSNARATWSLYQVAGKMNAEVSRDVKAAAEAIVAALNERSR